MNAFAAEGKAVARCLLVGISSSEAAATAGGAAAGAAFVVLLSFVSFLSLARLFLLGEEALDADAEGEGEPLGTVAFVGFSKILAK